MLQELERNDINPLSPKSDQHQISLVISMGDSRKYPYHTTDGFQDFHRGGGVHDYGILRAWGVFMIGNPKAWGNSTGGISGVESVE